MALITTDWKPGQTGTGSTDYQVQFDLKGDGTWEEMCFTAFTEDMGYVVEQIQDFCMQAQSNIVTAISPTWSGDLLLRFGTSSIDFYKRRWDMNQIQNIPMRVINSLVQDPNGPDEASDPTAMYEVITTNITITALSTAIEAATFMQMSVTVGLFDGNFKVEYLTRNEINGGTNTPDGQVQQLSAVVGDSQITLNWDASTVVGGTLTGYSIYYNDGVEGGPMTQLGTVDASTLQYVASGLTNGTEYVFTVYPIIDGSVSMVAGATITATPISSAPSAVQELTATPGDSSATITWTAPVTNSNNVSGYSVYVYETTGTAPTTPTGTTTESVLTYDATGLTNGTEYTVDVYAQQNGTDVESSKATTTFTPATTA